jgi:hypothetical protein
MKLLRTCIHTLVEEEELDFHGAVTRLVCFYMFVVVG